MDHLLCIGTTGMLAPCTRALIARGHRIACVARTRASLDALSHSISQDRRALLSTYPCDYRDFEALEQVLLSVGFTPDAAICWVHSPADPVLDLVRRQFPKIDLLRVVGSTTNVPVGAADPAERIVRLGFVIENNRSRWLSDEEVSKGVLDAFVSGASESTVGTLEPWDARP
ncbi:MAG: hypothetical protein ACF8LL_02710 [Phycisphaerales bacterium]